MWLRPACRASSWREPTPTKTATATDREAGIGWVTTRRPLSSTLRVNAVGPLDGRERRAARPLVT